MSPFAFQMPELPTPHPSRARFTLQIYENSQPSPTQQALASHLQH